MTDSENEKPPVKVEAATDSKANNSTGAKVRHAVYAFDIL
jgi:hypothetical protein